MCVTDDGIHSFCCLGDYFQRAIRKPTGGLDKASEARKRESSPVGVTLIGPNSGPHLRGPHAW